MKYKSSIQIYKFLYKGAIIEKKMSYEYNWLTYTIEWGYSIQVFMQKKWKIFRSEYQYL